MRCRACENTPRGFEGHTALGPLLHEHPPHGTAFGCLVCGTRWVRQHVAHGDFAWNLLREKVQEG